MNMENILDNHVKAYQGSNIYDFDNGIQLKWYPKRVVQAAEGASSLLELGLGHGITASVFEQHFKRHVVIDASPAVIENFRRQFPASKVEIAESYFEHVEPVHDPVEALERARSRGPVLVTGSLYLLADLDATG